MSLVAALLVFERAAAITASVDLLAPVALAATPAMPVVAAPSDPMRVVPVELLVNAAAQGDVATVQRQLASGTNPNVPSKSASLALPLVQAAANGHSGVVAALLQAGTLVDARDGRGQRALVVAAYYGRLDVCRQLLAAGAVADGTMEDELAPLVGAVMSNNVAVVDQLLQARASVTHADRHGRNALLTAARIGNEAVMLALLDALPAGKESVQSNLLQQARDEAAQSGRISLARLIESKFKP
jgi:ankyrin repeat protein